jgi:hypothetical protein
MRVRIARDGLHCGTRHHDDLQVLTGGLPHGQGGAGRIRTLTASRGVRCPGRSREALGKGVQSYGGSVCLSNLSFTAN